MSTYETPIPGAPAYGQANLLAQRAYSNAMARLQQRRSRSLQRFGYQRDASGTLSVDPNNEYGGYQQMLRGQDIGARRLDRAQRAGGWGTQSGYLGAQREDLSQQYGKQAGEFGTSVADEMSDIAQGEQGAEYARDQALYQNELDAAQRAIEQNAFNPADYTNLPVPDYGDENPRDTGALRPLPRIKPRPRPRPRANVHQRGRAQLVRRVAQGLRGRRR